MCGFVGGTNRDWRFDDAVDSLRHRGPDSQCITQVGRIKLGFARLAVIDPQPIANQPMPSADEQAWLVFNGEISGFRRLRRQLEQAGQRFRTESDTEVVLNAYLQWGDGFVDRIDGMFAIAIYDRREERLKLFRDRAGIKPLYYFWDGKEFAFASELKAIEKLFDESKLSIDRTALFDFLTYRYIPTPKTLYKNVAKLPAASRLIFSVAERRIEQTGRYWELPVNPNPSTPVSTESLCEELTDCIKQSVKDQSVADVPLGCFLSGGMDSSVVVATAAADIDALQTFSVGFESPEHTESQFAIRVASHFQTLHHDETFSRDDMPGKLSRLKDWYHEPFADTSAFPTYHLSKVARRHVTVALSGDGGDELFGGYRWYHRFRQLRKMGAGRSLGPANWLEKTKSQLRLGSVLRRTLSAVSAVASDELSLYVKLLGGMTRGEKWRYAEVLEIDADYDDYWYFRQFWRKDLPLLTRLQYLDFHTYLPDDILTKVDRVSMANSLEVRVPLLSRRLIEFAFSVPEPVRYHGNRLKGLLKHAYRNVLPQETLERGKRGFSVPNQYLPLQNNRVQEVILNELLQITT
jgi:asparagine synthase (glutamine-hydrolysing)